MQLKRSSSSTQTSMKLIKTMFLNLITHSLYSVLRSLSKAKSVLIEISKHNKKRLFTMMFYLNKSSINQRKVFFGSSFHVVPVNKPFPFSLHDADVDEDGYHESEYLEWLEEEVDDEDNNINDDDDHIVGDVDIDRLADVFIASCHEKFLLEKVESYRRYQEMLERSL